DSQEEEIGMNARDSRFRINGGNGLPKQAKGVVCFNCGKKGHFKSECRQNGMMYAKKPYQGSANSSELEEDEEEITFLTVESMPRKMGVNEWIVDSGATSHVCWNRDLFMDLKPWNGVRMMEVANGEKLKVEGKGTVQLIARDVNGKRVFINLPDVLFIPGM